MRFTKYQGLGNDFVLCETGAGQARPTAEEASALCDRRRGVGADGVLILSPCENAAARMEVLNADGSRAQMCGNGLRCVALHLRRRGLVGDAPFEVMTGAGSRRCQVFGFDGGATANEEAAEVSIEMGAPSLSPEALPMRAPALGGPLISGRLPVSVTAGLDDEVFTATAVSMGNPHLVLFDLDDARADALGPRLEHHPWFPERVNISFARVERDGALRLRVWERGAGWTQACGTGACATCVAAVLGGRAEPERDLVVRLPGGTLYVSVRADLSGVTMRGEAARVFEGEWYPSRGVR